MKKADSEFIKGRIAPCGLHCGKCFAFADGDISYHSNECVRNGCMINSSLARG